MSTNPDCIFCKILAGEIPTHMVWEDEKHAAFLDIFPLRQGQTIVIPKAHLPSSIYALPDDAYEGLMKAAKRVAELLERSLGAERTMVVGEGLEINHAHVKLYPRFTDEPGLVHGGPPYDFDKLGELARQIRGE